MNTKPDKTERTPFEKMQDLAKRVVNVSKAVVNKRQEEWRKEQEKKRPKKAA